VAYQEGEKGIMSITIPARGGGGGGRRREGNNRIILPALYFLTIGNTLLRDVTDFVIKFMAHAENNRAH
jgi:hypothetical protein